MFVPKIAIRHCVLLFVCLLTVGGCANSGNTELTKRSVLSHKHHTEYGKASYYANKYQGRKTASGQRLIKINQQQRIEHYLLVPKLK
ncbi:septal ring lytic transglycosylase RlpA family protein [Photobacterium angustum]|nr:septal ring lytic transglycosylase RlpA family protein [Photobacterium angustum]